MSYEIYELGDRGVTFQLPGQPSSASHTHLKKMKAWIDDHTFPALQDVVLSYTSITLLADRFALMQSGITDALVFFSDLFLRANTFALNSVEETVSKVWRIPVCYDPAFAFDIDIISAGNKISREEIIQLHTGTDYNVYMIGFLPGFPYLGFVDDRISFSRKDAPLARVPAGSVGIAGKQTGIYPMDSPGGWQIIGRTPHRLFDPMRDPPVELQPGDTVRFYEISIDEFQKTARPS